MTVPSTPPEFQRTSYNCPRCGAFAQQSWFEAFKQSTGSGFSPVPDLHVSVCSHCAGHALWFLPKQQPIPSHARQTQPGLAEAIQDANRARLIYPLAAQGALPSGDLPEDVKLDFEEARSIVGRSPRGAAALLRLAIQKLCIHLGQPGKDLNADIGALVGQGLPSKVQQALDTVRVIGNNAVHPGEIDLRDDLPTALRLFELVNIIADVMIGQPRRVEALYNDSLSPGQKAQIGKRDSTSDNPSPGAA